MQPDPELLENACSIREGLWRMARLARDAAESLDARIECPPLATATTATTTHNKGDDLP